MENKTSFKKGHKVSEETKRKISLANSNKIPNQYTREKMSISLKKAYKEGRHKLVKTNNSGTFKKGIRYSPKTEFKKGNIPWSKNTKGIIKAWNKIDGLSRKRKRKPLETKKIWCIANHMTRVPEGCVIHHIDQNPLNNSPDNLQMMDRTFHSKLHNEFCKILNGGKAVITA